MDMRMSVMLPELSVLQMPKLRTSRSGLRFKTDRLHV
jgi:hypothetical protein